MRKVLAGLIGVLLLVAGAAVFAQQENAWAHADLARNVTEFNSSSTLDECMDEIDGVWLPWRRAEARDMCTDAIGRP